jgi:type II secretory ATPase GspE/PulE/Tfp pilus assembly ATPase PilB-like protein
MGADETSARCEACLGTGSKGRLGVYELMTMNDELRRLTAQNADAVTLYQTACEHGYKPMLDDARDKMNMGLTTEDEIKRILH